MVYFIAGLILLFIAVWGAAYVVQEYGEWHYREYGVPVDNVKEMFLIILGWPFLLIVGWAYAIYLIITGKAHEA